MPLPASFEVVLAIAVQETVASSFVEVRPEHLLAAVLKFSELPPDTLARLAGRAGAAVAEDAKGLRQYLNAQHIDSTSIRYAIRARLGVGDAQAHGPAVTPGAEVRTILEAAVKHAAQVGAKSATALHLLQVLASNPAPLIRELLSPEGTLPGLAAPAPQAGPVAPRLPDLSARIAQVRRELLARVFGQEHAVAAFTEGLFCAEVVAGVDAERKGPRGIFVFAGPPGVGKTYLAEQGAALLDRPCRRFDMSGYADPNQISDLVGMSRGFKDAHPGSLTEFVTTHPEAVLIFDEIERAHPVIIQLFLQLLDHGVLEDKFLERNVSFRDSLVIFTTNAGSRLYGQPNSTGVQRANARFHRRSILDALANEKSPSSGQMIFPAALCSRLATGYPILFNHLGLADLERVVRGAMTQVASHLEKQYDKIVDFEEELPLCVLLREGLGADARTLKMQAQLFIKAEVYAFCRLFRPDRLGQVIEAVQRLRLVVDQSPEGMVEAVRPLFERQGKPRVLLVASPAAAAVLDAQVAEVEWLCAASPEAAADLLASTVPDLVLLELVPEPGSLAGDLSQTLQPFDRVPSGARALAPRLELLRRLRERQPELPVLLLAPAGGAEAEPFDADLLLACIRAGGARGVLPGLSSRPGLPGWDDARNRFVQALLGQARQLQRERRAQEWQRQQLVLGFETAPQWLTGDSTALIRLRRLRLARALGSADSGEVLEDVDRPADRFADVIGNGEAKEELGFFLNYLRQPRRFQTAGLRMPRGILLYGPPGTGKTKLARAFAGESDLAFLATVATNFVTIWQGSGPENVRALFARARRYAPAVVFIDEIDAIGQVRRGGPGGPRAEENTLNALLAEMDGFQRLPSPQPVFILAATNCRIDAEAGEDPQAAGRLLDPALLRRFDRLILVDLPTCDDRLEYLRQAVSRRPGQQLPEAALGHLAGRAAGMSIAQLEAVVEMAARAAMKQDRPLDASLLEEAFELARHGRATPWDEALRLRVARHEAGHALSYWLAGHWPAFISIAARAVHGGYMERDSNDWERPLRTRQELLADLRVCLGGRAAEILCYGPEEGLSTGAAGDLKAATRLARAILGQYGMGPPGHLAVLAAGDDSDAAAGARLLPMVETLLTSEFEHCLADLERQRGKLDQLVASLMERGRLSTPELRELLGPGPGRASPAAAAAGQ